VRATYDIDVEPLKEAGTTYGVGAEAVAVADRMNSNVDSGLRADGQGT
jgi:hypothetical protein